MTKQFNYGDKSGPWNNEPNYLRGKYKEYNWVIKRTHIGILCGYVLLPKGHKYYGEIEYNIPIEVHGGLTFAGEKGKYYWIGFDCAHSGDYIPSFQSPLIQLIQSNTTYKNINFVKKEIKNMIDQLPSMIIKEQKLVLEL